MGRIEHFYDKVFSVMKEPANDNEGRPQSSRSRNNNDKFKAKLKKLDSEEAVNPFVDFTMKSQVASYDLLQNEKYGRLEDLKSALEGFHLNTSAKS